MGTFIPSTWIRIINGTFTNNYKNRFNEIYVRRFMNRFIKRLMNRFIGLNTDAVRNRFMVRQKC